jgi:hypothetical protein
MSIIDFINYNSGLFQIISTFILVLITGFYTCFTYKILIQSRKQLQETLRPVITIFLENDLKGFFWINLIIKNTGKTIAKNISFSIEPKDYTYLRDRQFSEFGFIKYGIKTLSSNQEIKCFFENLYTNYDVVKNKELNIKIEYKDIHNNIYTDNFNINFNMYEKTLEIGEHPLNSISKELKKINSNLSEIKRKLPK